MIAQNHQYEIHGNYFQHTALSNYKNSDFLEELRCDKSALKE